MQASIILTVAQGKRLIAKSVAQHPFVQHALAHGIIAIGRGTTNAYVAEEILGRALPKHEYVAGRTLPPGTPWERFGGGAHPDIVLKQGKPVEGASIPAIVEEMQAGDVFIKGGNALNYTQGIVGVLMMHPAGGTLSAYGAIVSRKVELIIPIGLEKSVVEDIHLLSRLTRKGHTHPSAPVTSLFPISGTIVTEIEALQMLFGVKTHLIAAGGVAGAEGAIWLLLEGETKMLDKVLAQCEQLKSEPNLALRDTP